VNFAISMDIVVHTVALRPYVFAFLAVFLVIAARDLGVGRTLLFSVWVFAVAWTAEFASTRVGIPFGLYHYTGATRQQELFVSNVPFFDSLSFVFLAYAAYCLARFVLGRADGALVVVLAGICMTLLDVVIDPLAIRGARWFLGDVFYYAEAGAYFGVPLSNFAGWLVVGWTAVGGFAAAAAPAGATWPNRGVGLYYGVLVFNLIMTGWIGEVVLLVIGLTVHIAVLTALIVWRSAIAARLARAPRGLVREFEAGASELSEEGA
jgi:uncharacterized membrane protein